MPMIQACSLPANALLSRYRAEAYTDCFCTDLRCAITHEQFVEAFYTTWVFRIERWILSWSVRKPSSDEQAYRLACGEIDAFAAWQVEARCVRQILLTDFMHRTRSWLMSEPVELNAGVATRLYFGSAVIPVAHPRTGDAQMRGRFRALLAFHKVYSRVLLHAAGKRLRKAIH